MAEEKKDVVTTEQKSKIEAPSTENSTIKQNLKEIDDLISNGNDLVRSYKNEIDELKTEVSKMEGAVLSVVLEGEKSTNPLLVSSMENIITKINLQKDENAKLQKQLTELRKEKAQTQQTIYNLDARISTLEKEYGVK